MKFCQDHWALLRQRIDDRGLTGLIAKDGNVAAEQMHSQLQERATTKANFDPLMSSHWAIVNNAMRVLGDAGINPLYLMAAPEPGRNDCPLCELNRIHEENCTDPKCTLAKERGYDWMLDRAADEALSHARELKLVGQPS